MKTSILSYTSIYWNGFRVLFSVMKAPLGRKQSSVFSFLQERRSREKIRTGSDFFTGAKYKERSRASGANSFFRQIRSWCSDFAGFNLINQVFAICVIKIVV